MYPEDSPLPPFPRAVVSVLVVQTAVRNAMGNRSGFLYIVIDTIVTGRRVGFNIK